MAGRFLMSSIVVPEEKRAVNALISSHKPAWKGEFVTSQVMAAAWKPGHAVIISLLSVISLCFIARQTYAKKRNRKKPVRGKKGDLICESLFQSLYLREFLFSYG